MELVYRFLGLVAGWNEGMSRQRINLIPFNWIVIFGLGALLVTSLFSIQEGMTISHTPVAATVHELVGSASTAKRYLTVTGELQPDFVYQYGKKSSSGDFTVENTWMLMTTPQTPEGFFVQVPNEYFDDKKPRQVTLTGMWEPVSEELAKKLDEENFGAQKLTINTSSMLVAGASPAQPAVWAVILIVTAPLCAAFIITYFKKYTIFQPRPAAFSLERTAPANPPAHVRATGEFVLEGVARRRFLNVSTHPAMLDDGLFAFLSNIDASTRFFGVKTANRSGVWCIAFLPASVRDITQGSFYLGGGAAPALRFRYTDASQIKGTIKTAILSFASEQDRDAVLAELEKMSAPALA